MACPKCNSKITEKRVANNKPVLNYTCSGMHTRLNKVVVYKENHCKACGHTWK
ncbi:MAG: hypothetical protein ACTSXA_08605 [Candidatus Heimdallarchaeota archaeon]